MGLFRAHWECTSVRREDLLVYPQRCCTAKSHVAQKRVAVAPRRVDVAQRRVPVAQRRAAVAQRGVPVAQ